MTARRQQTFRCGAGGIEATRHDFQLSGLFAEHIRRVPKSPRVSQ
jgi:hypothetical protein